MTHYTSTGRFLASGQRLLDEVDAAGPPEKVKPLLHNLVYVTQDETLRVNAF